MNDKDYFDSVFGTPEQREIERTVRQRHAKIRHEQEMRDDIALRVLIALIEKASHPIDFLATLPVNAYQFADAMLAVREGQAPKSITSVSVNITGEGGGGSGGACAKAAELEPTVHIGKSGTLNYQDGLNAGVRVKFIGNRDAHYGTVSTQRNEERGLVLVIWDRGPATWERMSLLRIVGKNDGKDLGQIK